MQTLKYQVLSIFIQLLKKQNLPTGGWYPHYNTFNFMFLVWRIYNMCGQENFHSWLANIINWCTQRICFRTNKNWETTVLHLWGQTTCFTILTQPHTCLTICVVLSNSALHFVSPINIYSSLKHKNGHRFEWYLLKSIYLEYLRRNFENNYVM